MIYKHFEVAFFSGVWVSHERKTLRILHTYFSLLLQTNNSKLLTAKNMRMLLSQGRADLHLEKQSVFHEVSP